MRLSRLLAFALILLAWLLYPALAFVARSRRREPGEAPRILVIPQLSRVGDLVCATPVFRAIKERYPEAHLAVLVSEKVAGLLIDNPHIDEVIQIERYSFFALATKLRRERYDWSVSLVPTATNALLSVFALVPRRVKTVRSDAPITERLSDLLTLTRIRYAHHTYLPAHYLRTLAPLGITATDARPEVFTTAMSEGKAEAFLAAVAGKPVIGIAITAGNKIKEWGDERFIALAKALHERYDVAIAFLGGPQDGERVEAVIAEVGGANLVATDFSLAELPSLMQRLTLFIAVDTGPVYVAHALGVPLVDIIGPVDPTEQPPKDERSVQVLPAADVAPSSFVLKRAGSPAAHARAVASISVEQVLAAVTELAERTQCLALRA